MMETTTLTVIYIQPGDWAGSMDLSDTYFHVQIHPSSQIFLRLYEQRGFPLRVIPFGILTVPRVQPHDDCIRFLRMKGSLNYANFSTIGSPFRSKLSAQDLKASWSEIATLGLLLNTESLCE